MTRILVVDDAAYVRVLIQAVIEQHDHAWRVVAEACDGEEAVERARTEQPDLVLLDLSMPVMDGLEALPLIRAAAPDAVIVILTGFPARAARDAALANGADGYLEKDDIVESLVPQLQAILEDARGADHGCRSQASRPRLTAHDDRGRAWSHGTSGRGR